MIYRFFNNTRPATAAILLSILFIISIINIVSYYYSPVFYDLYSGNDSLSYLSKTVHIILSIIIVPIIGFLTNYIVLSNSITKNNSYSLLFFIVLIISHPALSIVNSVLISVLFIVISLKSLLNLQDHKTMTQNLFNAGFMIGVASTIYPYSIFYVSLIYLGIVIYGADSWRQWLIPIIGVSIPYYFLFTWHFWYDSLDVYWEKYFIKSIYFSTSEFHESTMTQIFWGLFLALTIFSIISYSRNMIHHKIDTRKGYAMIYLTLIIGVLISLVGSINNGQELILLFLPISVIWAKFIQDQKKSRWKNLFILTVIITSFLSYLLNNNYIITF